MLAKLLIIKNNHSIQSFAYDEMGELIYQLTEDNNANNLEVIYKAKIDSVNKKTKFAYINYLPGLQGIINLKNTNVQAGSQLLCQMVWQGNENKLPKFSEDIKLIGKYVIILPNATQHFFSKQLKSTLSMLSQKYQDIGIIFRSSIDEISNNILIDEEIKFFGKQFEHVKKWQEQPVGALTAPSYKFMQLLREARLSEGIEIYTNAQNIFDYITPYLDLWQINTLNFDELLATPKIDELSQKHAQFGLEIHKLSGINLIDVNSKNAQLNFYQVNYLAIDEIIRQIWLQDLTGIILIDFIKNMSTPEQQKLLTKITTLLGDDWRKHQVPGFTKAGICEIIRNK